MEIIEKFNQMNADGQLPHIVETVGVRPTEQLHESILRQLNLPGVPESMGSGLGNFTPETNPVFTDNER